MHNNNPDGSEGPDGFEGPDESEGLLAYTIIIPSQMEVAPLH